MMNFVSADQLKTKYKYDPGRVRI